MSSTRGASAPLPNIESLNCAAAAKLLETFIAAVRHANELSEQQVRAALAGDDDLQRFEMLMSLAVELRQTAKYAFMQHVEEHGCLTPLDRVISSE